MTKTYYYIAAAVLALYLFKKSKQDKLALNAKNVSKTEEAHPTNGTDWQGGIMERLAGTDLQSPNHANILPGANADGGGQSAQQLGLAPSWDGSLA